jgi:hypothetical protein
MNIQSLTPAKLLWQRAKQIAFTGATRWRGLNAYTRSAAQQIDETRTVQLSVFDAQMPDAASDALVNHGVTDICISLQKNVPCSPASLQSGVNTALRAIAICGKEESAFSINCGGTVIEIQPAEGTTLVNAVISDYEKNNLSGAGNNAVYFARRVLNRLPRKNIFSLNFYRGKLADMVISNEQLIDHFSSLTNLMLVLEDESYRSGCKKHAVFGAVLDQLFPAKDRNTLPLLLRMGIYVARYSSSIFYFAFKILVKQTARLFISGEDIASSLKEINHIYAQGQGPGVIIDHVAEEVKTDREAKKNIRKYIRSFDHLPEDRENFISIKLTGIVVNFYAGIANPATREETILKATLALSEIAEEAKKNGALIIIDMERHIAVDATLEIFEQTIRCSEYRFADTLGIVNQTYLKRSKEITARLAAFARECRDHSGEAIELFIRFVKGAYQFRDRDDVVESHAAADKRFIECLEIAYRQFDLIRFAIASHNLATLSDATELARSMGLDSARLESEMLKGMPTTPILDALAKMRRKTRVYFPVGTCFEAIGYFLRRMRENASSTSCQKLFRDYYAGRISREEYLSRAFAPAKDDLIKFIPERERLHAIADDLDARAKEKIIDFHSARGRRQAKLGDKIKCLQAARNIFEKMEREAA